MTTYAVKLLGHRLVAENTMAFRFERPAGFNFKAGQAVEITLTDPPTTDARGTRRAFSLVNAPYENELIVATRMRDSAFKRELKAAACGTRVQLEGPFGSLTLHNNRARPAVFIAGGIGITPFMSMLRQAAKDALDQRLLLIYSNRRPEDAAFLSELGQLEQQNRNFQLVATMSGMSKSKHAWDGERGQINEALLKRWVNHLPAPIYYAAGPPSMTHAIREMLNRTGIDDDDIRSEDFAGY